MVDSQHQLGRSLVAEGLGSFFLFATVIGSGIMAEQLAGGNLGIALLGNTLATAAMLYVLITMLGPISGAHFNPAVTVVMVLRRALSWRDAVLYAAVQIGFGVVGAWAAHLMFEQPIFQISDHSRSGTGQWVSEAIASFGLVLTIIGTLHFRPQSVAASVALFITAAYWFTASTSFANPAITVARSLTNSFSGIAPGDVPGFIAAQIIGALAASLIAVRLFKEGDKTDTSV